MEKLVLGNHVIFTDIVQSGNQEGQNAGGDAPRRVSIYCKFKDAFSEAPVVSLTPMFTDPNGYAQYTPGLVTVTKDQVSGYMMIGAEGPSQNAIPIHVIAIGKKK